MCAQVFWCTWHVWKLNKDLSLTVGHVHNHSKIIRETGRRVGLLASWSKCWQGRRAIKLKRAVSLTDIIKDVEMSLYCDLTDSRSFSGSVHPSCIIFHSVTCACSSYKYLSCHHTITQIFGSESLKMFKSDYSKTEKWVINLRSSDSPKRRFLWHFLPCCLCYSECTKSIFILNSFRW